MWWPQCPPIRKPEEPVFLMSRDDLPAYRIAREEALGEIKPPTTLVITSGLAKPIWKVEIEAFAAKL